MSKQLILKYNLPKVLKHIKNNAYARCNHRSYTSAVEYLTILNGFDLIQSSIYNLHAITSTPWWATIALSTVIVRISLFPLVRLQLFESKKLSTAMPELSLLYKFLVQKLQGNGSNISEKSRLVGVFFKGLNACLKIHDVKKVNLIAYPIFNASIFMSFIYSIRNLITHGNELEFMQGGLFWFKDLELSDPTSILPLVTIGLSYLTLELAFSTNKSKNLTIFKDIGQSIMILTIPFVSTLSSGIFCYWIPSSLYAMLQTIIIRNPTAIKILKLPEPINNKPQHTTATTTSSST